MSILFDKITPEAREIAEEKLRAEGVLAPDAPLEYAFEVLPSEMAALEAARKEQCDVAGIHLLAGLGMVLLARGKFSKPLFEDSLKELEKDRQWISKRNSR